MRVLIIEDEHKIANSIKKGLQQESFAADVAYTGTDGFDLADTESYDALIIDIMLPGMDGISICKKLRANNNQTPILMLTAKGQVDDKVTGLNAGADDYLSKPFAFEELLARIRAISRRPPQTLKTTLSYDTLKLNTVTFEVSRSNQQIHLTNREFALLEYLLRHANIIIPKDQIINHVWNYDADVLPNTVEVYIGYLRNKIDKPFPNENQIIQTIRGFGYKIGNQ